MSSWVFTATDFSAGVERIRTMRKVRGGKEGKGSREAEAEAKGDLAMQQQGVRWTG